MTRLSGFFGQQLVPRKYVRRCETCHKTMRLICAPAYGISFLIRLSLSLSLPLSLSLSPPLPLELLQPYLPHSEMAGFTGHVQQMAQHLLVKTLRSL